MTHPTLNTPCPGCGFRHQCLCHELPKLDSNLHIALLVHPNEVARSTNTGQLLANSLANCHQYVWDRVTPAASLIQRLSQPNYQPLLVFPSDDSTQITEMDFSQSNQTPLYIVLDGTWQEAKKMLNKSAWLRDIPAVSLPTLSQSRYSLRRNQQTGHLCTVEVGCELLKHHHYPQQAEKLLTFFAHYLKVFQADRSGHALKQ
ncbi:DTW domain-containing protein [Vibrio sp. S4M6]|uniref:tRNA-uridine aminocarboxypropyltransferase n=1 Tax=Vibrio sinus TaxID=2946865 RepID=UPI00202A2DED|nr:DTW domain-containing protein [Vibrio sinus]MCL9783553.1 DTW domain-containing protein [Vibrio sinus]